MLYFKSLLASNFRNWSHFPEWTRLVDFQIKIPRPSIFDGQSCVPNMKFFGAAGITWPSKRESCWNMLWTRLLSRVIYTKSWRLDPERAIWYNLGLLNCVDFALGDCFWHFDVATGFLKTDKSNDWNECPNDKSTPQTFLMVRDLSAVGVFYLRQKHHCALYNFGSFTFYLDFRHLVWRTQFDF